MVDADVAQQAARAPKRPKGKACKATSRWDRLFHWNELPEYLRDNEYIYTGYRVHTGVLGSFKSLFRIHNESGNVWTHLLGTGCLRVLMTGRRFVCFEVFKHAPLVLVPLPTVQMPVARCAHRVLAFPRIHRSSAVQGLFFSSAC